MGIRGELSSPYLCSIKTLKACTSMLNPHRWFNLFLPGLLLGLCDIFQTLCLHLCLCNVEEKKSFFLLQMILHVRTWKAWMFLFSWPWRCACWLSVTLSLLTGSLEWNWAMPNVIIITCGSQNISQPVLDTWNEQDHSTLSELKRRCNQIELETPVCVHGL